MRQHNTPLADNVELVFLFETDSVHEVEGCVKSWLSEDTYRVGREIYYAIDDEHVQRLLVDGMRHAGCAQVTP